MSFTFDQETHTGMMDGVFWPSVTQILGELKLVDYSMVPEEILENKRILGTRVHYATALIDNCELDEADTAERFPEILPYLEAYRKFRIIEKFEPSEQKIGRLYSPKWLFHGELDEAGDRIEKRGAENYIIDYKTTFKLFPSTGPQTAAYSLLLCERLKIRVKKRFGLLLKSNGNYELHPLNDPSDLLDFHAALRIWWQRVKKYQTLDPKKLLKGGSPC